mmetsp:Transcript_15520/g.64419  ORF Transcript_15520/g.64419 Transcript_15520/m.64419 type:complete len:231 (+) Transcript_15520:544-1236(+)
MHVLHVSVLLGVEITVLTVHVLVDAQAEYVVHEIMAGCGQRVEKLQEHLGSVVHLRLLKERAAGKDLRKRDSKGRGGHGTATRASCNAVRGGIVFLEDGAQSVDQAISPRIGTRTHARSLAHLEEPPAERRQMPETLNHGVEEAVVLARIIRQAGSASDQPGPRRALHRRAWRGLAAPEAGRAVVGVARAERARVLLVPHALLERLGHVTLEGLVDQVALIGSTDLLLFV